jgi:chromosome segregation protein
MGEAFDHTTIQATEQRLAKLLYDREAIGGVNLRADEEVAEQEARLTALIADKDDLTSAIAKLRGGVDQINAEGKERLVAAFDTVHGHFRVLFEALFDGGTAELRLTESDDPLGGGLEVYACPPGKKLQSLTLMSGGEQALTASALIFAVFLSNPSPICVLDEVDAPLDDSNVDRYCRLLNEMRQRTETRFIVITHHPITMARMDRLFGVTMAERGVSQLVSVDLSRAEALISAE